MKDEGRPAPPFGSLAALFRQFEPSALRRVLILLLAAGLTLLIAHRDWLGYSAGERLIYDQSIRLGREVSEEQRIVIVDIDEASLASIGPWPWPRSRLADLLGKLVDDYRAALVGVDIVFPDERPGDPVLRARLKDRPIVLAQAFDLAPLSVNRAGVLTDPLAAPDVRSLRRAAGYIGNSPSLLAPGQAAGHITPTLDPDGKVRRLYPVLCHGEREAVCSATLGLRMYQWLNDSRRLSYRPASAWQPPLLALESAAGLSVPLDREGGILLPYRIPPGGFALVSAAEVLSGRADPDRLAGTLVLVGSTALGLGDRVATPRETMTPGVEVHAQLLSALLDGDLLREPAAAWREWAVLPWMLLSSLLLLFFGRGHPVQMLLWALASAGLWSLLNGSLRYYGGLVLPLLPGLIFSLLAFMLLAPFEIRRLGKRLGGAIRHFSAYAPESVVHALLDDNGNTRAAAGQPLSEERIITTLFADIHGFTPMVERLGPDELSVLMHKLLEVFAEAVTRHHGTIEKFTGDGIMALWGAPDPDPDHALHAVEAALDLQESLRQLHGWLAERQLPPIKLGVGINTGPAIVGIFGSAERQTYSAQGDSVNVANRLEQLTRPLQEAILLGEETARRIPPMPVRDLGRHAVAGKRDAIGVYALASPHDRKNLPA